MRLSLVFPSWFGTFGSFSRAAQRVSTFPPLNLCIIASLAEREGWQAQIIDAHIEGLDNAAILRRIEDFSPDLVGLTATTPFFPAAVQLARQIRARFHVPVMIGGTHASILREAAFEECFDYLFVGECERTFPEFLRRFAAGERPIQMPGLMCRVGKEIVYGGEGPVLEDLDQAPPPARHLLPNSRYLMGTLGGRRLYTSVQMSRGCPFSCVFCASDLHGRSLRMRGLTSVADELELVVRRMGVQHVYFVDDTLTVNRRFILGLCDEIERRGLLFTFEGSTRADLWDEEMVRRLRSCGLVRISFGLESADPEVRRIIRKEVPMEAYAEANRLSRRLGIETISSVIIGLPGDTRESIERTVRYVADSRDILHVTLNTAIPYPGTEMLRMAQDGRYGLKIVERDYSRYQRYESAVMEVNGIGPAELVALQRRALLRIYSRPWRAIPVLRRFGFPAAAMTGLRVGLRFLGRPFRPRVPRGR